MDSNGQNRPRERKRQGNFEGFIANRKTKVLPSSSPAVGNNTPDNRNSDEISAIRQDSILNRSIPPSFSQPTNKPMTTDFAKRQRRRRRRKRILFIVIIVLLGLIGAGAWDAWQLYHKVHRLSVGNLSASVGGAENILVAGSTNRCNLKVQNAEWGFCSQGVTGVNSDIIFIIHIVPQTHTLSLLSIPRDTFVPDARSGNQAYKIDAALYQGPTQLVSAIEEDFGIPIQHYVEVGFDGFVNIVNAVGGIKMNFPMPVYDSESYLDVKTAGCRILNGVEALQVVRARHLQYKAPGITTNNVNYWPQENQSDIARIARTHEFLRVLAATVAAQNLSNPITDQKLVDAIAPQVQVDNGFSTSSMIALMQDFHSVIITNVPQYTLPIVTTGFGSYEYDGNTFGDVVFPYEGTDEQIIGQFLGSSKTTNTMTGQPLPAVKNVTVNIINGSGVSGQAGQIATGLQSLGFNVAGQPTTAKPASYQANETVVYYANSGTEGKALAVADQLTGFVILSQNSNMVTEGSDVTVVTGTGVTVNVPASTGSATNGSTTTSGSSTAANPSNSTTATTTTSIGPVSSSNEPLTAWDPTACTPNQPLVN